MKDRIPISKALMPYKYNIELGGNIFIMEFKRNSYTDTFTVSLYNSGGEVLCYNEPIVYGVPLFKDVYEQSFPAVEIVPCDESGQENTVNSENLGKTVFLNIFNSENDTVLYKDKITDTVDFKNTDLNFVVITAEELKSLENAIISKGGRVDKKSRIATIKELEEGILSIPKSEMYIKNMPILSGKTLNYIIGEVV